MRLRPPSIVLLALTACGDSAPAEQASGTGSEGGDAADSSPSGSTDDGGDESGDADTGECVDDDDCGEHAICVDGMCTCADGFVECGDECVPPHAATVDVELDEVIDARPEVGRHFDLSVAPGEVPLVVYELGSFGSLWFARRDAAWSVEEAWPALDNRLDDAAVAASADGDVEIALASFYDGTSAYRSGRDAGEGWAFASMVSLDNSAIGAIDLAFDPNGTPHYLLDFLSSISFQRSVYLTPGNLLSIMPMSSESGASDLVIDDTGAPQIAYDISGDGFYHARHDGSEWVHTQLSEHPINNYFVSIDIAATSDGRARIVAFDDRMDELLIAREEAGGWTTEVVLSEPELRLVRIAIDANDVEHLVYFALPDRVMYGRNDGATWSFVQVGTGTDGRFPLVAVDDPHQAHIVYGFDDPADANDPELRYVRMAITPLCE